MKWDSADLERRLCRALDIAGKTVETFAAHGYTDEETPQLGFGGDKPIAETTMLLYAASGCARGRPGVTRRVEDLVRLVQPHARSERVLVDIALQPGLAFKFAVPHILLTQLGYPDSSFDRLLEICAESVARNGHDRPPSALLERRWITSLWSGRFRTAAWRDDLRDSVVNWPVDILHGRREDAYAFTHLMFYCTDFGFKTPRLPRPRSVVLGEAAALLARFMDAEDYDLSGEILMSWPLTGRTWSPTAAFAFRVLAHAEDEAGLLPCGNVNLSRLAQLSGDERARYALGTAYHTAYVMGFLCAAALQPGKAPPASIVGERFDRTYVHALRACVADDQGHWQSEFATLGDAEQEALAPFLLDVGIVQQVRKHDYERLRGLVLLASDHGPVSSALYPQAVELLERIAVCSAAINERRVGSSTSEPTAETLGAA